MPLCPTIEGLHPVQGFRGQKWKHSSLKDSWFPAVKQQTGIYIHKFAHT